MATEQKQESIFVKIILKSCDMHAILLFTSTVLVKRLLIGKMWKSE